MELNICSLYYDSPYLKATANNGMPVRLCSMLMPALALHATNADYWYAS